jgi:hypothetical protein
VVAVTVDAPTYTFPVFPGAPRTTTPAASAPVPRAAAAEPWVRTRDPANGAVGNGMRSFGVGFACLSIRSRFESANVLEKLLS